MGCGSGGEVLVGLVIQKRPANSFQSSKSDSGGTRQVFSFTLRDSTTHWITCNVWGDEQYISNLFESFQIGDIIEICNFQVQPKTDSQDKFNPFTTVQVCVHLSQRSESNIQKHEGPYATRLQSLSNFPVCNPRDFYTIAEVSDEQSELASQQINMLACVKKIGSIQLLKSRNGKDLHKIEVLLIDNSIPNPFLLTIWDKCMCEYASRWQELSTVVFATDLRVTYSEYKKKMVASSTSRSIFICNPETEESVQLFHHAQEVAATQAVTQNDSTTQDGAGLMDDGPLQQMTVEGVRGEVAKRNETGSERCMMIVAITSLDIDSSRSKQFIGHKCSSCNYSVGDASAVSCPNPTCATSANNSFQPIACYDVRIDISDHTGTLEQARLSSRAAEAMFNMKAGDRSEVEVVA